jgi:hypothetical protein
MSSLRIIRSTFVVTIENINCNTTKVIWPPMEKFESQSQICNVDSCKPVSDPTKRQESQSSVTVRSSVSLPVSLFGCDLGATYNPALFSSFGRRDAFVSRPNMMIENQNLGSDVLDITLPGYSPGEILPAPFDFTLDRTTNTDLRPSCVYYDIDALQWSTDGCTTLDYSRDRVMCQCNHLTSFAVLTSTQDTQLSRADALALDIISYIGLGISIFCLLITIFTLLRFQVRTC